MKYDFDHVHDRIHDPRSYAMKYSAMREPMPMFGIDKMFPDGLLPDDTAVFVTADMDFDMAPPIVEACKNVATLPNYGYSGMRKDYYEAVCRWFHVHYGWDFDPSDVYYCNGTHAGVVDAIKYFTNPGAGVLLFVPSYPFKGDVDQVGRHYVPLDFIHNENGYETDWEALETAAKDPKNEALIIVQPHNPLGFAYSDDDLKRMAKICRENNMVLIADMVHIDIHRAGKHCDPVAKVVGSENVVSLTGLAKTFNISGLNMSNMIVSDPKMKEKLVGRFAGATPFGIAAATAAYTQCDDWVEELNVYIDGLVEYCEKFFAENMPKLRFTRPDYSYIMYLDFSAYGLSGDEINERLLKKAKVLLSDGAMVGGPAPEQHKRLCITSPMSVVKAALDRMKEAFADVE